MRADTYLIYPGLSVEVEKVELGSTGLILATKYEN